MEYRHFSIAACALVALACGSGGSDSDQATADDHESPASPEASGNDQAGPNTEVDDRGAGDEREVEMPTAPDRAQDPSDEEAEGPEGPDGPAPDDADAVVEPAADVVDDVGMVMGETDDPSPVDVPPVDDGAADIATLVVADSVLANEGSLDCAIDVALDEESIYVIDRGSSVLYTPEATDTITSTFALRKVNSSMDTVWSVSLGSVVAAAVTTAADGAPVVSAQTGAADGSVSGSLLITMHSADDGNEITRWQGEQLIEQSYYGEAFALTASDGSLFVGVTGQFLSYDQGEPQWTFLGPEAIHALALASDGSILVGGQLEATRDGASWVARLDATGDTSWSYHDKLTADGQTEYGVAALAADDDGSVYALVNHLIGDEPGPIRWGLLKLNAGGETEWLTDLGAYDGLSQANGVQYLVGTVTPNDVVMMDELVIVAGQKDGDLWLAAFDRRGEAVWERVHAGGSDGLDEATAVLPTSGGRLLVAGCETIRMEPGNDYAYCANVQGACEPPAIPIKSAWVGLVELP
jgi:hypothetical protein